MRTTSLFLLALIGCSSSEQTAIETSATWNPDATPVWYDQLSEDADLAATVAHTCLAFEQTDWVVRAAVGTTRTGTVVVENLCDRDITLHAVELTDGDGAMELAGMSDDRIPAGGVLEIDVDFTARGEHIHLGELVVRSSDDALPAVGVNVVGLWREESLRAASSLVSDAGPNLNNIVGTQFTLDGSDSSPGSYLWAFRPGRKPVGSSSTIADATQSVAHLTPDLVGNYELRLDVSDGFDLARDFTIVTAAPAPGNPNTEPVARIAGGAVQQGFVGSASLLDGSPSYDPDTLLTDGLSYRWRFASVPAGSSATITNPTSDVASFVPDVPGSYQVRLRVDDGLLYHIRAVRFDVSGDPPPDEVVTLRGSGDNHYDLFVDGTEVASDTDWPSVNTTLATLSPGPHTIAVRVADVGADQMMILILNDDTSSPLAVSDSSWSTFAIASGAGAEPTGWQDVGFDDSGWSPATVCGANGTAPWGSLIAGANFIWGDGGCSGPNNKTLFRKVVNVPSTP